MNDTEKPKPQTGMVGVFLVAAELLARRGFVGLADFAQRVWRGPAGERSTLQPGVVGSHTPRFG
jgi:hypothetical protein